MATLQKGTFELNLGVVKLGGDLSDIDRQCAWEVYTELTTRIAVTGHTGVKGYLKFDGEVYIESLTSLYNFFQEIRLIMRRFPVGKLVGQKKHHLGILIHDILNSVLRPFLEKWQSKYRYWWEYESNPRITPVLRQSEFEEVKEFLHDWAALRYLMRKVEITLAKKYKLTLVR